VFICKLNEGNPPEDRKILSFVLDRGLPGFEQSKPLRKMGMHSSPTGVLFLSDVRVGRDRLIGETEDVPSGGREGAKDTFSMERSGVAAMSLGIIERCLELSVQYAKDRVQFGRPIGSFQAIKHKCADMLLEVESAKSAAYYAAWCAAEMNDELPSVASLAKAYCSEAYFHAAAENIQIHGGIGFTWEHPAHLYFKRAKSSELLFGDPSYHRELLAQRIGI
jgi:alkylation response protein AidB-like acyl-CoA dehydrogenase